MLRENPFSTRFVRPGEIPYRLSPSCDLQALVARFESRGRLGQIVGPHGSGKSTLLAELIRRWESSGERVVVVELHDGQRRLPLRLSTLLHNESPTLIAVDGYEQLNRFNRRSLCRFCRRKGIGLVVTAHQSMGIPDLARCAAGVATVEEVVRHLLHGETTGITTEMIRDSFHRHDGDVREVLFELYDLVEAGIPND